MVRRRWVVRCVCDDEVIASTWFLFRRSARRYAQWQERTAHGDHDWLSAGVRLYAATHGPLWTVTISRADG